MIGSQDLLVGLVIVLVLIGAKKLPELAASLGKSMKEFKKGVSEAEEEEPPKPTGPSLTQGCLCQGQNRSGLPSHTEGNGSSPVPATCCRSGRFSALLASWSRAANENNPMIVARCRSSTTSRSCGPASSGA